MKKNILTMLALSSASFLALPMVAQAAVIAVTSGTFAPELSPGKTMLDNTSYNLTSLTVGSNTYTDLLGPTASNVAGTFQFHTYTAADPGTADQSVSGLDLSIGIGNIAVGGTFQFGAPLQSFQGFAAFELGGVEAFSLTLVDSLGNDIGTTPYTIIAGTYGAALAVPEPAGWSRPSFSTNPTRFGTGTGPSGTFFEFSDFGGGTGGDLSQATGFRINNSNGVDPFGVVAVVPEPSATALLAGAAGALAAFALLRRRRSIAQG